MKIQKFFHISINQLYIYTITKLPIGDVYLLLSPILAGDNNLSEATFWGLLIVYKEAIYPPIEWPTKVTESLIFNFSINSFNWFTYISIEKYLDSNSCVDEPQPNKSIA